MKAAKIAFLIISVLWVILFICLSKLAHGVSGEASMGIYIIYMILAYPSSTVFEYVVRHSEVLANMIQSEFTFNLIFFTMSYLQWSIPFACVIKKICREYNSENEHKKQNEGINNKKKA